MEHVNGWYFRDIYNGGLWKDDLHVSAPHDSGYLHDRRADSNNQCIILRLQLSFVMINVQLMLV